MQHDGHDHEDDDDDDGLVILMVCVMNSGARLAFMSSTLLEMQHRGCDNDDKSWPAEPAG